MLCIVKNDVKTKAINDNYILGRNILTVPSSTKSLHPCILTWE